jgi:hypothetical protein
MNKVDKIDRYEPDYQVECDICGQKPTVTGI